MLKLFRFFRTKPYVQQLYVGGVGFFVVVSLLIARIAVSGEAAYLLLVWNICLALIAWGLGVWFVWLARSGRMPLSAKWVFVAWLLFLPNTFYIITDLIHPILMYARIDNFSGSDFLSVPKGALMMTDIVIVSLAAWVGWFLGIVSMRSVYAALKAHVNRAWSNMAVVLIGAASSYAIYLGRVPRLNSWDVLYRPGAFVREVFEPLTDPLSNMSAYAIVVVLFVAIMATFWSFEILSPSRQSKGSF